jgi:ribose transport system ATP-binding protein
VRLRTPRDAIRAGLGIALVPEDRKTEGLLLPMTVKANLTLAVLGRISWLGLVRNRREVEWTREMIQALSVRPPELARPVGTLSGGNQQKVLIGRWLLADCCVLLLYDVTRGRGSDPSARRPKENSRRRRHSIGYGLPNS